MFFLQDSFEQKIFLYKSFLEKRIPLLASRPGLGLITMRARLASSIITI